jgi:hypothetical protein
MQVTIGCTQLVDEAAGDHIIANVNAVLVDPTVAAMQSASHPSLAYASAYAGQYLAI